MTKEIECIVICNTRLGYTLPPHRCASIAEAVGYAKRLEMSYKIFVDRKLVEWGHSD